MSINHYSLSIDHVVHVKDLVIEVMVSEKRVVFVLQRDSADKLEVMLSIEDFNLVVVCHSSSLFSFLLHSFNCFLIMLLKKSLLVKFRFVSPDKEISISSIEQDRRVTKVSSVLCAILPFKSVNFVRLVKLIFFLLESVGIKRNPPVLLVLSEEESSLIN